MNDWEVFCMGVVEVVIALCISALFVAITVYIIGSLILN